jgi:hypothetical protein
MDNQSQAADQTQSPPLPSPDPNKIQAVNPYPSPPSKPALTEADAQALLAVNGLQPHNSPRLSRRSFIAIVIAIVVIITIVLVAVGHNSSTSTGGSSIGLPSTGNNPLNNGGSINQDEQYCANPVNASTTC